MTTVVSLAAVARHAREREQAIVDSLVTSHRRGTISAGVAFAALAEISALRWLVETLNADTAPAPERAPLPSPGGALSHA